MGNDALKVVFNQPAKPLQMSVSCGAADVDLSGKGGNKMKTKKVALLLVGVLSDRGTVPLSAFL